MKAIIKHARPGFDSEGARSSGQLIDVYDIPDQLKPASLQGFPPEDLYFIPASSTAFDLMRSRKKDYNELPPGTFIPKGDVNIYIEEPIPFYYQGREYSRTARIGKLTVHIMEEEREGRVRVRKRSGHEEIIHLSDADVFLTAYQETAPNDFQLKDEAFISREKGAAIRAERKEAGSYSGFYSSEKNMLSCLIKKEVDRLCEQRDSKIFPEYAVEAFQKVIDEFTALNKKLKS